MLDQHVQFLDHDLDQRYLAATTNLQRRELALAGLTNLLLWLGWIQSVETFGLKWADTTLITPHMAPSVDLPAGCGVLNYKMLPETKTSWSTRPNIVMAYPALSLDFVLANGSIMLAFTVMCSMIGLKITVLSFHTKTVLLGPLITFVTLTSTLCSMPSRQPEILSCVPLMVHQAIPLKINSGHCTVTVVVPTPMCCGVAP